MKIGIVCYPTYGGSGVIATELGKALSEKGNHVHFITYELPVRLNFHNNNLYYQNNNYSLFLWDEWCSYLVREVFFLFRIAHLKII